MVHFLAIFCKLLLNLPKFTGCLALKFQDLIKSRGQYLGVDWKMFFMFFQSNIKLERNTYDDIKDCLVLCDKLEISAEQRCKGEYILENLEFNFLQSESYRELRLVLCCFFITFVNKKVSCCSVF